MAKLPTLNSFRGRVLALLVALVTVTQLATFAVTLTSTERNVESRLRQELRIGADLFEHILGERGQRLLSSARALANDPGFEQAVASEDSAIIRSALFEHRTHSDADALMMLTLDGQVTASTLQQSDEPTPFPVPGLLHLAEKEGELSGIGLIEGRPYQIVLNPVLAPHPIAWMALALPIDQELATHLHSLTGLQVTFLSRGDAAPFIASTLAFGPHQRLARKLRRVAQEPGTSTIYLNSEPYITLTRSLSAEDDQPQLLLQASLRDALAPYNGMRWQLLAVTVVALLLSLGTAAVLARNISRPIGSLLRVVLRIQRGEYGYPLRLLDHQEFDTLASAFNRMQDGIAEREAQLYCESRHDSLNGLPTRNLASDRLDGALARSRRSGEPLALCLVNVGHISEINDTLGQELGDKVLQEVAHRLHGFLRESDTLARIGGDKFLLLLEGTDRAEAEKISEALRLTLQQPLELQGQVLHLDASVGIAVFPQDGHEAASLWHRAHIAVRPNGVGPESVATDPLTKSVRASDSTSPRSRRA